MNRILTPDEAARAFKDDLDRFTEHLSAEQKEMFLTAFVAEWQRQQGLFPEPPK